MPIYERNNRTIHHIHIPKCGGQSIQKLLVDSGWKRKDLSVPVHLQHEIRKSFKSSEEFQTCHEHRNIWNSWNLDLEFQFAIVRNPYDRLMSRMRQSKYHNEELFDSVGEIFNFLNWILSAARPGVVQIAYPPGRPSVVVGGEGMMDNHFRPQVDFIGPDTHVYKMEEDIESLFGTLISNGIVSKDSCLEKINSKKGAVDVEIPWNDPSLRQIHTTFCNLYHQDFNLFDYPKLVIENM